MTSIQDVEIHMKNNFEEMVKNTYIIECRIAAQASGMNQKFIDGITYDIIDSGKKNVVRIYNTFTARNKLTGVLSVPVAKFLEYGTKVHFIKPVIAKALKFADNRYIAGSAGISKPGGFLFSKGHFVSGIIGTRAMERGKENGAKRLNALITKKISEIDE